MLGISRMALVKPANLSELTETKSKLTSDFPSCHEELAKGSVALKGKQIIKFNKSDKENVLQ